MKTILCPVDFSKSSERISEYAAQMARDNNAKIALTAINPRFDKVPAGEFDVKQETTDRLGEWHDWIVERFKTPCSVEEEPAQNNAYSKLGLMADRFDLMIVGSQDGAKRKTRQWLGLDLVKTIQGTLAPLLIVPEHYQYKKIKRLLYAYDYRHQSEMPMMQLGWLANWFNAEVKLISILPDEISTTKEDKFYSVMEDMKNKWGTNKPLSFETIIFDNVARCLEHYLSLWEMNDLLVLSVNHQSFIEKIWQKSVVKQLLKFGTHPYMILHK